MTLAAVYAAVEGLMKSHFALALALVAFVPAAASAQSQDEQQACMNDAFTVCGDAIPDRGRVAACLAQNLNRISAPCRAVMARYSKPGTGSSTRRERVIEQGDRYDRGGDQFDRPDRYEQFEQRSGRYGRY
jgi:hypothetical protein